MSVAGSVGRVDYNCEVLRRAAPAQDDKVGMRYGFDGDVAAALPSFEEVPFALAGVSMPNVFR